MEGQCSPQDLIHGMDMSMYSEVAGLLIPKSPAEVADAYLANHKVIAKTELNQACTAMILALYPLEIQSSMSLGIYPAAEVTKMVEWIAAMIEESNRVSDAIDLAADADGIMAARLSAVWPNINDFPRVVI